MTLGSLGQGDRGGGEPAKGMWKSSCHLGLGSVLLDLQEPQNKPLIYLSEGVGYLYANSQPSLIKCCSGHLNSLHFQPVCVRRKGGEGRAQDKQAEVGQGHQTHY